jgi:tetratricopeptide (TPR) repeat protein
MIGKTLAHYEILDQVGHGGMGEIYRARDTRLNREVALKVLPSEMALDPENQKRFEQEARAVAALKHPNIVTIYSVEQADGIHFLTMELIEGRTLAARLADGRSHADELCDILIPLVDALGAAHARGIVHRDLKPGNVMLTPEGQVKLLDFGVSKLAPDAPSDALTQLPRTDTGVVIGTPAYMSPEQLRGQPVDSRSDLFSLGILMYELATGRHPFSEENPAEIISSILRDSPPPCPEMEGTRLEALIRVLERCLEKDPDLRYQSALEVREELEAMKAGRTGVAAAPHSPGEDLLKRGRAAFERQEWTEAYELLAEADSCGLLETPDLELLAESAWWAGNIEECQRIRERAYAGYLERDQNARAGLMAAELAEDYYGKQSRSVASGWLKRAERLLEESDSAEAGYLNRLHSKLTTDPERSLELSERTIEVGKKFHDANLEAMGIMDRGQALVSLGRVPEGMALIDEAMTSAVSGRLSPQVTGRIYCNMMSACEELADYQRAAEWSDEATRWCEPHQNPAYPGICRVHRAEVMRVRGKWDEAEEAAKMACDQLGGYLVHVSAQALYKIGEIRLQRGDLEQAENAFNQAHEMGRDPLPGLARLRMAQGKVEAAQNLMQRALGETTAPLDRARLLPAWIEIAVDTGGSEAARSAIEELDTIGEEFGSVVFQTAARHGRGLLLLHEKEPEEAARELRQAWKAWNDLDLPYEGARARLLLGQAYREAGNLEDSELELRAARSAFEKLGAKRDSETTSEIQQEG